MVSIVRPLFGIPKFVSIITTTTTNPGKIMEVTFLEDVY